jgi:hypothetical protein
MSGEEIGLNGDCTAGFAASLQPGAAALHGVLLQHHAVCKVRTQTINLKT